MGSRRRLSVDGHVEFVLPTGHPAQGQLYIQSDSSVKRCGREWWLMPVIPTVLGGGAGWKT